jgi:UDP-glucose 4-epimerase
MILVTGSAGHLGEALMRSFRADGVPARGIDIKPSAHTDIVASIADREAVAAAMAGITDVLHTATLHKPHVVTHSHQMFVDTNITGTLNLLEEAVSAGVRAFVFTSTTSTFGDALSPSPSEPAAWITEDVREIPKNIYGATKLGAEHLCQIVARNRKLPVLVLRTSRFFPEEDDNAGQRSRFPIENLQALELLNRRVDIADIVSAHRLAIARAPAIGFGKFIISATSPFTQADLPDLSRDAGAVILRHYPQAADLFAQAGWSLPQALDRVYVNARARRALGWAPRHDFAHVLACLAAGREFRSDLALSIGWKGYHDEVFEDGPFPVE